MTKEEVIAYAAERFSAEPEYLWARYPEAFVLRHSGNRKWFAVSMAVKRAALGLPGQGEVWVMDVKCGPLLLGGFRDTPGVIPAYHMNKTHWLGVLLDGTAGADTVKTLLEISYDLTAEKPRRKERNHD